MISQGYGYVQFENPDDAEQAKQDLKGASINGREVEIKYYEEFFQLNPDNFFQNCYIENLPKYVYEPQLNRLFSEFGEPLKCTVFIGNDYNYGYCLMGSNEEAKRVIEGLNGRIIGDSILSYSRAKTGLEKQVYEKKQREKRRRENHKKVKGRNL